MPGLVIDHTAVASHDLSEYGCPVLMLKGSCDGDKLVLHVWLEPIPGSEAAEVIDTIREVCRVPRRPGGEQDRRR